VQGQLDLGELANAHLGDGAGPEDLAQHRPVLEQALPLRGQRVQASGDQRLDAFGEDSFACVQAAVGKQADELLGVERIAASPLEHRPLELAAEHTGADQVRDQLGRFAVGKGREVDRVRVSQAGAPAGPPLVELGPRRA
jgi:hypothetical protein